MAASHVQHKLTRGGGTATIAVTFDSNVAAGNAIAVYVHWRNAATLTLVADSLLNSYTLIHNPVASGLDTWSAMAYATGITAGACVVTATFTGGPPGESDIAVHESTGTTLAFDASDLAWGTDLGSGTDAWDPASAATFTAGAIVNAFAMDDGNNSTWTAGTGYTGRLNVAEVASETQVFAAGGSLAGKFTNSDGFIDAFVGILGFTEAAGAAAPVRLRRMLYMGAG